MPGPINTTRCLIHASSDPRDSGVVVKGENPRPLVQQQKFMGDPLDFYTVTLA